MKSSNGERKRTEINVEEFLVSLFKDAIVTFETTHPDKLPHDDPRVKALFLPYHSWIRVQVRNAERTGTTEAQLEMSLKVSSFLVEAGFTDPDYIDEVVNDFLAQDFAQAEGLGLLDLASRIQAKQETLLGLL